MIKVVFIRHGESLWNLDNRFTGWTDVDLTARGMLEARQAGLRLREEGFEFDYAFSSVLRRAIRTLWLVQEAMDALWLPVAKDWRLNERHYGTLQGLNKAEVAAHYGDEQTHLWRRGFDIRPPELPYSDPRHPRFDKRYRRLDPSLLPATESLKDTMQRAIAYWDEAILPALREGQRVIVVAHGNTLRALVKKLDKLSDEAIMELNIPTGVPLVYEFDDAMRVLTSYYLPTTQVAPEEILNTTIASQAA